MAISPNISGRPQGFLSRLMAMASRALPRKFADPATEAAFWEQSFERSSRVWKQHLQLIMACSFAGTGIYPLIAPNIKPLTMGTLIALSLVTVGLEVIRSRVNANWLLGWPMVVITGFIQTVALTIVFTSDSPFHINEITYLCIILGGLSSNGARQQLASIIYPAVAYGLFIISLDDAPVRYIVYQYVFLSLVCGITIVICFSRANYERLEFRLSRELRHALASSDQLLRNVLPGPIAEKMKERHGKSDAMVEEFENASVLFADLVGFTSFAASQAPERTVQVLNDIFRRFDAIAEQCGIEKIKTMGDAYMAVAGLPERIDDHNRRIADAALEMREAMVKFRHLTGIELQVRIGIHCGPVIAGIIGTKRFLYDLWGDTVNTAARLESHGIPGSIQVSVAFARQLEAKYIFRRRGMVELKGKGLMETFVLEGPVVASTDKEEEILRQSA